MREHLIGYAAVICYVTILAAVAMYGFHRYVLLYLYLKHKKDAYQPLGTFEEMPRITVQLPMFNEEMVAERIIKATCQIDYPLDRLQIQVLDDSTDHSAEIAKRCVDQWRAKNDTLIGHCERIGRDPSEIYRTAHVAWPAGADPSALADQAAAFAAAGIDQVIFSMRGPYNAREVEPLGTALQRIA